MMRVRAHVGSGFQPAAGFLAGALFGLSRDAGQKPGGGLKARPHTYASDSTLMSYTLVAPILLTGRRILLGRHILVGCQ